MKKTFIILITLLIHFISVVAQEENNKANNNQNNNIYHNWYNKSANNDQVCGIDIDKAYKLLLKNKVSNTVIVAVIDGGVDINHEDLKENIWINKNEIPNNGIDDDKNGYIDDINGWNFLGTSSGESIIYENLEVTRIYREYKDKFKKVDPKTLNDEEKSQYDIYENAKNSYFKRKDEAQKAQDQMKSMIGNYIEATMKIELYLGTNVITLSVLNKIKSNDKILMKHVNYLKQFYTNDFSEKSLTVKAYSSEEINYYYNLDYKPREIIGDNINDISTIHGNNNVCESKAFHGTFVSGIIAAKRDNGIGINGIADNVKIMVLKVVPKGDERDKDVAMAIRYAADNGARIINMSFGKQFSPQKHLVDNAIRYAESKGVLLVHAAGNDGLNIDKIEQFPTKIINQDFFIENWITVGASSMNNDFEFAAKFTNFGKNMVDVFAPGVNIKSLAPKNKYIVADGTSFACPIVSGLAALLLSYYPDLTASQIKSIILNSIVDYSNVKVYLPGNLSKKVKFKKLSKTGGIVNAYKAIKMAEEFSR